jgi:hypothetical protein
MMLRWNASPLEKPIIYSFFMLYVTFKIVYQIGPNEYLGLEDQLHHLVVQNHTCDWYKHNAYLPIVITNKLRIFRWMP